jgi:triosephosphate isomerase
MSTWIVGNWKMNGSVQYVETFFQELLRGLPEGLNEAGVRVAVCPPHPYLAMAAREIAGTPVELGAQKVHPLPAGAFTGEVSPAMLAEFGARMCIIGHSEHRQHFGVTDAIIAEKLHALINEGIAPILCVGETLREREEGRQEEVIETQIAAALKESAGEKMGRRQSDIIVAPHPALPEGGARRLVIAYEPVWAIGTGKTATPEQANMMHQFIRGLLAEHYSEALAAELPILYGGSANENNAGELLAQPEINGALVGGASLKAPSFLSIINQALNR